MSFASKLRILRNENKMTQEEVAARLNLARSHEKLTAIAEFFHVTVDYLLEEETVTLENSQCIIHESLEKTLIAKYRKLSPESKQRLMDYIRLLELSDAQSP